MLGQIRGKFSQVPIPGQSITLNHSELLTQAKEEQTALREKLIEMLKEMEYQELVKTSADKASETARTFLFSPVPIFVG